MLSRINDRIHRWLHAGEENAIAVYAGRWKANLSVGCAILILLFVFF
jgi:hypothetical protein